MESPKKIWLKNFIKGGKPGIIIGENLFLIVQRQTDLFTKRPVTKMPHLVGRGICDNL